MMVCAGVCLGVALGLAQSMIYATQVSRVDDVGGKFLFRATEDGREGTYGDYVYAKLLSVNGEEVQGNTLICVYYDDATVWFGDEFSVVGIISPASTDYMRENRLAGSISTSELVVWPSDGLSGSIASLRKRVVEAIASVAGNTSEATSSTEEDASISTEFAVLEALVCGYRYDLFTGDVYDDFKVAGVAHLVAVSGAHLSVMFGLISLVLKRTKLSRRVSLALQLCALVAYLFFSAIPISALRAAMMVSIGLFSFVFGRRPATLNALAICIIVILVSDPTAALSSSFILSASSTLGILLFSGLAEHWIKTLFPYSPKGVTSALALTLSSSVMSLPFSCALFSQCALVSLLTNLLCAPLFTLTCSAGLAAAVAFTALPAAGTLLFSVAGAFSGILCAVVEVCASIPYACVAVDIGMASALGLTFAMTIVLWCAWPAPSVRGVIGCFALLAVAILASALLSPNEDRIVMFDIGQGDAILVESEGRSILIDTGDEPTLLRQALARAGVTHLDAVAISHPDQDHCGSLSDLALVCEIDTLVVAADLMECACSSCSSLMELAENLGIQVIGLEVGDTLSFGIFTCEVVWPYEFSDEGGNDDSLCLVVSAQAYSIDENPGFYLLTSGDAGYAQQLEAFGDEPIDLDVIKVSHHGSYTGTDEALLEALLPEVALISVGEDNRYGHPHDEVLAYLEEAGCTVYRTDESGDISLEFSAGAVELTCQQR